MKTTNNTMPTNEQNKANSEVYYMVQKAKRNVDVMLERLRGDGNTPNTILEFAFNEFTPYEKVVMACGHFVWEQGSPDSEPKLIFKLPSTANVISYINHGIFKYENGYTKLVVKTNNRFEEGYRETSIQVYERFAKKVVEAPDDQDNE